MEMNSMVPKEVPSYWMPYFGAEDVDKAHQKGRRWQAARKCCRRRDFPGGRFSILQDPQGRCLRPDEDGSPELALQEDDLSGPAIVRARFFLWFQMIRRLGAEADSSGFRGAGAFRPVLGPTVRFRAHDFRPALRQTCGMLMVPSAAFFEISAGTLAYRMGGFRRPRRL